MKAVAAAAAIPSRMVLIAIIISLLWCYIMIPPNTLLLSSFVIQHQRQRQHHRRHGITLWASTSTSSSRRKDNINDIVVDRIKIEGLIDDEEFNRLVAIDKTLRSLQLQLPAVLTKPLTPSTVEEVYSKKDFSLSVLVDDKNKNSNTNTNNNNNNDEDLDDDDLDDLDDDFDDKFQENGTTKNDKENKEEEGILILNSREELVALSDVLVLSTAAAQQAILFSGGTTDTRVQIECQLIIDDTCSIIRIPWRAKIPTLGSLSSRYNNFEGITDCYLSTTSSEDNGSGGDTCSDGTGKVERFVIKKSSYNGRTLNGPSIVQALKSIKLTVSNLQQNPIIQNIVRDNSFFNTLRDGFLDQAATAMSTRLSSVEVSSSSTVDDDDDANFDPQNTTVPIYQVNSMDELSIATGNGWIDEKSSATIGNKKTTRKSDAKQTGESSSSSESPPSSLSSSLFHPPCPGTKDWNEYVDTRSCIIRFSNDIIPQLSDLSIVNPKLFADDVTYKIADESILMTGCESLANFYQSMALTRKATGGTWTMYRCKVLDWTNRTVAITYEVTTNSLPQWTIRGRDVYDLDTTTSREDRPIIAEIRQGKMIALGPNGNKIKLDGRWLVDNVAAAFQQQGGSSGSKSIKVPRDFLTELLMNQPSLSPFLQKQKSTPATTTPSSFTTEAGSTGKKKLSKIAAAACYYIMADLYEDGLSLFDMSSPSSSTRTRSPPAFKHIAENVELRGYFGESILRGSSLYNRSIGSVIMGIRESIRQGRLSIEEGKIVPPRVELLVPTGEIRLTLTFLFRIPPPGAGIIMPSSKSSSSDSPPIITSGLPLRVELVSDYRIDPDTGLIVEHRLVETRINGQLSAGDQVSRWIQRFLKLEGGSDTNAKTNSNGGEDALKAISDALSWFRSI
jgi:hypothetical protein